jgi:hypothetical protein
VSEKTGMHYKKRFKIPIQMFVGTLSYFGSFVLISIGLVSYSNISNTICSWEGEKSNSKTEKTEKTER